MDIHCMSVSISQRSCILFLVLVLLTYYIIMDIILYKTLQAVDIVNEKKDSNQLWSPFRPLSVKLIMQDPTTHYVLTPLSEYFNEFSHFSEIFPFITPNMITFTHVLLSFVCAKFIFSDSLRSRRIGCLIFELRSFLDAFDGTVFRAHARNKTYTSHHNELGFWIDSVSDTIGGFALCFAVLFYFYWKVPPKKEVTSLPWTSEDTNGKGLKNGKNGIHDVSVEKHETRAYKYYSKKFIFWRCFCYGAQIGLASSFWDQTMWSLNDIFTTKFKDENLSHLQSVELHSFMTSLVFWGWRLLEGQALQHYFLVVIWMDKIWEFLRFVQYIGLVAIGMLSVISYYHVWQVQHVLGMLQKTS